LRWGQLEAAAEGRAKEVAVLGAEAREQRALAAALSVQVSALSKLRLREGGRREGGWREKGGRGGKMDGGGERGVC